MIQTIDFIIRQICILVLIPTLPTSVSLAKLFNPSGLQFFHPYNKFKIIPTFRIAMKIKIIYLKYLTQKRPSKMSVVIFITALTIIIQDIYNYLFLHFSYYKYLHKKNYKNS